MVCGPRRNDGRSCQGYINVFPEFGQTPKCLELDLDTYEESWTHVSAFQARSGWLLVARATIQSENEVLSGKLIAACDEFETPIPAWRARHLTDCQWGQLDYCCEEPPEILDDLLCEEEGAFYARWQREMNTGLAALYDRAQRDIDALEAKATARTRTIDFQIADLRRRRRMVGVSDEAHAALSDIIAELEAENDQALARLARQRAALRHEADAAEEALWQRTDVLIEVEPMYLVHWRAKHRENVEELLCPDRHGTGGVSLRSYQLAKPRLLAERLARERAKRERQAAQERERQCVQAAEALAKKQEADLRRPLKRQAKTAARTPQSPKSVPQAEPTPAPRRVVMAVSYPSDCKLHGERDSLVTMLAGLEAKEQRLVPGSRKYPESQEERAEPAGRIDALNGVIAGHGAVPEAATIGSLPIPSPAERSDDQPNVWPNDRVEMLRRLWEQGMSASDIGRAIGGVNRNAVIGKAKRLGLPMRAQTGMPARQATENKLAAES